MIKSLVFRATKIECCLSRWRSLRSTSTIKKGCLQFFLTKSRPRESATASNKYKMKWSQVPIYEVPQQPFFAEMFKELEINLTHFNTNFITKSVWILAFWTTLESPVWIQTKSMKFFYDIKKYEWKCMTGMLYLLLFFILLGFLFLQFLCIWRITVSKCKIILSISLFPNLINGTSISIIDDTIIVASI